MPWKTSAAEMAIRYGANTSVLDWRERLFSLRRPTGRYCGDRNGAAAGGASDMAEIDPDRFTLRPVEALRYTYAQVMKELDLVKELVLRPKHMIHDRYNRHARPCAGHPWRQQGVCRSSRMAGTSPAMTTERTVCLRLMHWLLELEPREPPAVQLGPGRPAVMAALAQQEAGELLAGPA